MKKTIFAILVCGVMVLGLTGCGKTKTYAVNEEIEYKGIKIIFSSEYEVKTDRDGYEVKIPIEIRNTSDSTYDVEKNGPYFDVYTPSGISQSTYNKGYLETWGQIKIKSNATLKDIIKFKTKELGEYTFESSDGKIKISYNIEVTN